MSKLYARMEEDKCSVSSHALTSFHYSVGVFDESQTGNYPELKLHGGLSVRYVLSISADRQITSPSLWVSKETNCKSNQLKIVG